MNHKNQAFKNFISSEGSIYAFDIQKNIYRFVQRQDVKTLGYDTQRLGTDVRLIQAYFRVSANEEFIGRDWLNVFLDQLSLKLRSAPISYVSELPTEIKLRERKEKGVPDLFNSYHITFLADLQNNPAAILRFLSNLESAYSPEKSQNDINGQTFSATIDELKTETLSAVSLEDAKEELIEDLVDEDIDEKIYPVEVGKYQRTLSDPETFLISWRIPVTHFIGFREVLAGSINELGMEFFHQNIDIKLTVECNSDDYSYLMGLPLFQYNNFLASPLMLNYFSAVDLDI